MKEEIIKTSLQQFLLQGIRKMTVKEIIAPLGISTKTVYKYFENKEALLEECLELHYSELYKDLIALSERLSNPVLFIFQAYKKGIDLDFKVNASFYHDLNYYYPELQDKILSKTSEKLSLPFMDTFKRGIELGYLRNDMNVDVVFKGLSVLYASLTRSNQFESFNVSPFELAANTIEIYLRGLCTEKGLQEIDNNPELTSFNKSRSI